MDRATFDKQVAAALPKLRNVVRKVVGSADECDDVIQDAMLKAWEKIDSFAGRAQFSTWLCAIGVRCAQDYLRTRQRWRSRSQIIYADQCLKDPEWGGEVGQAFSEASIAYEVKEHIAYCFSCVGRSLPPVDQAALVLRDVVGMTNREAGNVLGLSESVFRQHLSSARNEMSEKYEGLCALVNQQGVCYQCTALRSGFADDRQGQLPDELAQGLSFELRTKIVADADIDTGKTQGLHELFWKRTQEVEQRQLGDESVTTDCGRTGN